MSKSLSTKEVATHKSVENGLWIIIDNEVYDVTKFIDEHPGGPKILKRVGGKDASKQFWKVRLCHPSNIAVHFISRRNIQS
jgi:cytochrome b involved in lipid metabolism